ncbi:MAG TPA: aspartate 1-decarboxylase [Thermoanaerobaculia bacterium]|nr:aspartate 1-decarboxylase [Thermoanaerobaculia bacterium]
MIRRFLRAAIHDATVTSASGVAARIDPILLRAAEVLPLEEVEIVNHTTNERFTTYVDAAEEASGEVSVPHTRQRDVISILSWGLLHDGQTLAHRAKLIRVDASNRVVSLLES